MPELVLKGQGDPAADRKVIRLANEEVLRKLYQGEYHLQPRKHHESVIRRLWLGLICPLLADDPLAEKTLPDTIQFEALTRQAHPQLTILSAYDGLEIEL